MLAKHHRGKYITHTTVEQALCPFLLKGGFIRVLPPEFEWTNARMQQLWGDAIYRTKKRVDWGAVRPEKRLGRKPWLQLVLECQNPDCYKKPATFKGQTIDKALRRAWSMGWHYRVEDGVEICFCSKCKPGVPTNGKFVKGMMLHNRADGELYMVEYYVGKGDHTLNFGHWPELWCLDKNKNIKIFIFWDGEIQTGLAVVQK